MWSILGTCVFVDNSYRILICIKSILAVTEAMDSISLLLWGEVSIGQGSLQGWLTNGVNFKMFSLTLHECSF